MVHEQSNKVELLLGGLAAMAKNVKRFHTGGTSDGKLIVKPFETEAGLHYA